MKLLTAAQIREVDRLSTERFGIPSLQLMENAGTRVVEFLESRFGDLRNRKIVALCGKGNNGGDGLVVARLLKQRGCNPAVLLFALPEALKGDAAVNFKRWQEASAELHVVTTPPEWEGIWGTVTAADIVVDALLGTGLTGPVEGLLRVVIEDVNRRPSKVKVVAVDIPSGLASDGEDSGGPVVRADDTVTFTAPKLGHVLSSQSRCVGHLVVRSIGSPRELLDGNPEFKLHWLEPSEFRSLPLRRRPEAHKGDFGHALIVAGSRGKSGAAVLAAWGALRAGAGLVTVATPDNILPVVASGLPELMTAPLQDTETGSISLRNLDYGRFAELAKDKSVLALGPGLSTHPETQQFVRAVVAEAALPVLLDADGLNAFAGHAEELQTRKTASLAVTPHPGEMARLLACTSRDVQRDRLQTALQAAARWKAFVVLKGYRTIVAAPDGRAYINSTGNPGMATGGTGDVLTGILAGLTAQFGVAQWATVLAFGVYLHGLAGDFAAAQVGQTSLIATDLVRALPQAFKEIFSEMKREA